MANQKEKEGRMFQTEGGAGTKDGHSLLGFPYQEWLKDMRRSNLEKRSLINMQDSYVPKLLGDQNQA